MNHAAEEADRLFYFQLAHEGFERAARSAGAILDRYYSLGGYIINLRFAGDALLDKIDPALAHLGTDPVATPDFTVCLWDSASTNTQLPLLVNSLINLLRLTWWEQLDGRREIKAYSDGRIRSTFHLGPDILSVLDNHKSLAVYWCPDAEQLPYYERAYPLRTLLNLWTATRQRMFVHAAAVGTKQGGVLLAGQGGSGKSSTTLACLLSGLQIASDDYTILALDPEPTAYSLYNTVKLHTAQDAARFPAFRQSIVEAGVADDKRPMLSLQKHYPDQIVRSFPIRAVLLPHVNGGKDSWVQRTTAVNALKALAPTTLLQLSGSGQGAFTAMARLVKRVPIYSLELGTDIEQIATVIKNVLRELR